MVSTARGLRIPTLVPVAREVFADFMGERANQIDRQWPEVSAIASELLAVRVPGGEISRSQVWQWVHHGAKLADGRRITRELVQHFADDEIAKICGACGRKRLRAAVMPRRSRSSKRSPLATSFLSS